MNRMRIWTVAGCGLLLAAVGGCAGTEVAEDQSYQETQEAVLEEELAKRDLHLGESVDRIPNYNLSSWSYIDSQHVTVTVGVSKRYLVTLMRYCRGLAGSSNVRFDTTGSDLTTLDQLIVGQERCQIQDIHRLEPVPEEE